MNPWRRPPHSPIGQTLHLRGVQVLSQLELLSVIVGVAAVAIRHGLFEVTRLVHFELGLVVLLALAFLTWSLWKRWKWSRARQTYVREHRLPILLSGLWVLGFIVIQVAGPALIEWRPALHSRAVAFLLWSEMLLIVRSLIGGLQLLRRSAATGGNPALLLVVSFLVLVALGTLLLMLPQARAQTGTSGDANGAPLTVALFTATSASCITGLAVVPTGSYWSRFGQTVILALIQIGGMGIMTFGVLFAVLARSRMQAREAATLGEMLESESPGHVRQLLLSIVTFTFLCELLGAALLTGLWDPSLPLGERLYFSLFHAVSAFCNAGFSLKDEGLLGLATRWQVWGVIAGLIIVGGLGFAVLYDLWLGVRSRGIPLQGRRLLRKPRERVRLDLTTKLVLITTAALLAGGTVAFFLLESRGESSDPLATRIADAWFQSVSYRTAGFNSVDHGALEPGTLLLGVVLMFIGASPGSTGGGIRTVCFALSVLGVLTVLRGRDRVEALGRTIPLIQITRALTIISLGVLVVMTTTLCLVIFENRPEQFLEHLYEATSAFATVGVSTGITPDLSIPSRLALTATMFLGRVGPLTMLLALAGRARNGRYEYPAERVVLG